MSQDEESLAGKTCPIEVAECLYLLEEYCCSKKMTGTLKFIPTSEPDPSHGEWT
jgi:hypothetical protein